MLEAKGTGGEGRDFDDVILFPWRVFQRLVAGNEISQTMYAAAAHGAPLSIAREQIRALLRQRHRLAKDENDDFRIVDRSVAAQASAETTRTFNWLLTTIACSQASPVQEETVTSPLAKGATPTRAESLYEAGTYLVNDSDFASKQAADWSSAETIRVELGAYYFEPVNLTF